MKKPWLAALLNLLLFGGGYVYNGRRKGLGYALILAWVLLRVGEIRIFLSGLVFQDWLVVFLGLVVLMFSLASDAYQEAKAISG